MPIPSPASRPARAWRRCGTTRLSPARDARRLDFLGALERGVYVRARASEKRRASRPASSRPRRGREPEVVAAPRASSPATAPRTSPRSAPSRPARKSSLLPIRNSLGLMDSLSAGVCACIVGLGADAERAPAEPVPQRVRDGDVGGDEFPLVDRATAHGGAEGVPQQCTRSHPTPRARGRTPSPRRSPRRYPRATTTRPRFDPRLEAPGSPPPRRASPCPRRGRASSRAPPNLGCACTITTPCFSSSRGEDAAAFVSRRRDSNSR